MVYLGVDPSFSGTGIVLYDPAGKQIHFYKSKPPGTNANYQLLLSRSALIAFDLVRALYDYHEDVITVIEEPLLTTQKAASMGVLSASLTWTLAYHPQVLEMYSVNPSYVGVVGRAMMKITGLNKKQAIKHAVLQILEYFTKVKGYDIIIHNDKLNNDGTPKARQLSTDEADSFVLMLVLLAHKGVLNPDDMSFLKSIHRNFYYKAKINQYK